MNDFGGNVPARLQLGAPTPVNGYPPVRLSRALGRRRGSRVSAYRHGGFRAAAGLLATVQAAPVSG
jgi:hypothetical protein